MESEISCVLRQSARLCYDLRQIDDHSLHAYFMSGLYSLHDMPHEAAPDRYLGV